MTEAVAELDNLLRSGRIADENLRTIQNYESLLTEKALPSRSNEIQCVLDNIQNKFNHFSVLFHNEIKLSIDGEDTAPPSGHEQSKGKS